MTDERSEERISPNSKLILFNNNYDCDKCRFERQRDVDGR